MGSMCKCQTVDIKSCQTEISIKSKKKLSQVQGKNDQIVASSQDQNLRAFYIIYPKNEKDLVRLLKELEVLNRDEQYEIEEYQQISKGSKRNEIDSYNNINCNSDESFKKIHFTNDLENIEESLLIYK